MIVIDGQEKLLMQPVAGIIELEELRAATGAQWVESVTAPSRDDESTDIVFWMDEEGRFVDNVVDNFRATEVFEEITGNRLNWPLVGTVVICASNDEGECVGLTDEQVHEILETALM